MRVIALYQANSRAALARSRPTLESLLRLPGVAGFSLRVPANVLNPAPNDWSGLDIFDDAMEIAEAVGGCEVQFRSMNGRSTPRHGAARWATFPGGTLGGTDSNLKAFDYPPTFDELGDWAHHFFGYVMRLQDVLIAASREAQARGLKCEVVHMSHPAGTWAEVFVIEQMEDLPGYNLDTIIDFHVAVMEAAAAKWPQVEFALSGHVYPKEIQGLVYGSLSQVARDADGRIVINRNDIRNHTNFDGIPTGYPLAWQSYAAGSTYKKGPATITYNWPLILDEAEKRNVVYYEAYPGNFDASFRSEIAERYAA
jgi:hypothetical protein